MKRRLSTSRRGIATVWALAVLLADGTAAQPPLATGEQAEVTEDGLHRVDPSVMDAAWVHPQINLSGYTKVFVMPARVQFREVGSVSPGVRARGDVDAFPINEVRRAQLSELWGQLFYDDITALDSFELVTEVGRDVLLIRGDLIDVISGVPPDEIAGGATTTVLYPWAASAVLEVRDSMSDELLARTIDRRRVEGPLDATAVWARTSSMVGRWSQLLCDRLEELNALNAR